MTAKWERRDAKRLARTRGMRVTGRSVFVIKAALVKRDAASIQDRKGQS